jgi:anti-sigma factor RsiW
MNERTKEDELKDDEMDRLIRRAFDPVLTEPVPARMHLRRPAWIGYARAASILAVGIAIGVASAPYLPTYGDAAPERGLPMRAARAHAVYVSEVRHPVEVDASQQAHLVAWLSKRLDYKLRIPVLANEGYELLGGRLLPGAQGPVAQFMYQEPSGARLTLYVSRRTGAESPTAFRFAQEGNVSVFYWIDRDCGYALSGDLDRPKLAKVANAVYRQLGE